MFSSISGPWLTFTGTMISLIGSAVISLFLVPRIAAKRARQRQDNAWIAHAGEVIRDFRESFAVLKSIAEDGYNDSFPLQHHITKLGIPETLLTTKIIAVGDLSEKNRKTALRLENLLVNVNRDVATLLRLIEKERRNVFDSAASDLSDKFYNLANSLLRDNPMIKPPEQSLKPKTIVYEDGTVRTGLAFQLRPEDQDDPRVRPANH